MKGAMKLHIKAIGSAAAATAALVVVERMLPAIAAGLVALAHELSPRAARKEAARRAQGDILD